MMGRRPVPAIDRFASKVAVTDGGCLEWIGNIDRYGYGQFRPGGRETSNVGAHRWSYEYHVGAIPSGLHIDHLCRNRKCVNPDHLEPVTPRENTLRGIAPASLNAQKTHCLKGHPLFGENIYAGARQRVCKTCKKAASDANYRKSRTAA